MPGLLHPDSGANRKTDRRIGHAISYIPAHVRPVGAVQPSALRVRGRDQAHGEALVRFRALQDAGFQPAPGAGA